MKNFCIIFMLLINTYSYCQGSRTRISNEPFENCNTIRIATSEKPEEAFRTVKNILLNYGYDFSVLDKASLHIETKFTEKTFGFSDLGTVILSIIVFIEPDDSVSVIKVTGKINESATSISCSGGEDSKMFGAWSHLNHLATTYPQAKYLTYRIQ